MNNHKLEITMKKNSKGNQIAHKYIRTSGQVLKRRMKLADAYFMLATGQARIANDNLFGVRK